MNGTNQYRLSVDCEDNVMTIQAIKGQTWHANMGEIYDPDMGITHQVSPCACDNPQELLSQLTLDDPIVQRLLEELDGRKDNAMVSLHQV